MALRNQSSRNENLLIHTGDTGKALKSDLSLPAKSSKKTLGEANKKQARKALVDVSNTAIKPPRNVSNPKQKSVSKPLKDVSNLKEKSISKPLKDVSNLREKSISNEKKDKSILEASENAAKTKSSILSEEEIKECEEWAKEGIEYCGWTGTDQINYENEQMEKRIKEEVDMVSSCMHKWGNDIFDLVLPRWEEPDDIELKWEILPEILPKTSSRRYEEDLEDKRKIEEFEAELAKLDDEFWFAPIELKLKPEFDY